MANNTTYLSDVISVEEVFETAFSTPVMRILPGSKKRPTLDQANKAVLNAIKTLMVGKMVDDFQPVLQEAYDEFLLEHGDHAHSDDTERWEELCDQMVETVLEPYTPYLSQSWLGEHTIASGLHVPDGVAIFSKSLGEGYYKEMIHGRTPGQILSSLGLTAKDVEARFTDHINPSEEEQEAMANQQNDDLDSVLQKIATHIGAGHDANAVIEDLDLASDDDEGLAAGAAARLGLDPESDLTVLQGERLVHGKEAADMMHHRVQELIDGGKKKGKGKGKAAKKEPKSLIPPADEEEDTDFLNAGDDEEDESFLEVEEEPAAPAAKPKKEKAEKKPKAAKPAPAETDGAIAAEVLLALKGAGAGDTETASGVGVSRTTYTHYLNGKIAFNANDAQRDYIRQQIVDKANSLLDALGLLDGTEAQSVF